MLMISKRETKYIYISQYIYIYIYIYKIENRGRDSYGFNYVLTNCGGEMTRKSLIYIILHRKWLIIIIVITIYDTSCTCMCKQSK